MSPLISLTYDISLYRLTEIGLVGNKSVDLHTGHSYIPLYRLTEIGLVGNRRLFQRIDLVFFRTLPIN